MSESLWGQIITGLVTLGLAFIGYLKLRHKQDEQIKKVEVIDQKTNDQTTKIDKLKEQTDGMKSELVEAVKGRFQAEGELKGKADQKIIEQEIQQEKQAAVDIALKIPVPIDKDATIDVNIVAQKDPVNVKIDDQTKPVDVKVTKETKKP